MRGWILGAFVLTACSSDPGAGLTTGGNGWGAGGGNGNPGTTEDGGRPTGNIGGGGGGGNMAPTEPQLETQLALTEIAVFQGVKVSVMKDGALPARKAPVIAGREALIRAYVRPEQGFTPHEVTARLAIDTNGQVTQLEAKLTPSAVSSDDAMGSTFNFKVPGAQIGAASKLRISLLDAAKMGPPPSPSPSAARWPADGTLGALDARSSGGQLKIVLVPVRYGADGSNRMPDTSANQLQLYASNMLAMYPTPKVDITVRQNPVTINFAVASNGTGWNQLLSTVLGTRASDAPGADVYYYGVFAPAASMQAYCGGGCVAGLSPVVMNIGDAASRASIGLGFTGASAAGTLAHELGHAHGLPHAPCGGATGTDPNYPYMAGGIGSWGYSLASQQLVSPTANKDVMSYCNPQWISDYNFNLLFQRIKGVNGAAVVQGPPVSYRYAALEPDGAIVFTGAATLTVPPAGTPVGVRFDDGALGTAFYYPSDHVSGGTLLVPDHPGDVILDTRSLLSPSTKAL